MKKLTLFQKQLKVHRIILVWNKIRNKQAKHQYPHEGDKEKATQYYEDKEH